MATLQQALTRIDAICPNAWDDAAKIQWLNECEHMIQMRILDAAPEQCVTYDADTERGTVLLVPAPFDRLYVYYVIAMCDYAAHETAHYADSMALFNAALDEYAKWHQRTNGAAVPSPGQSHQIAINSAIDYCVRHGLMSGFDATTFSPDTVSTRAQIVMILYNLSGDTTDYSKYYVPFTDVRPGTWYYNAVAWGYDKDIVAGMTPTTFAPDGLITREQMAVLLYGYTEKYAPAYLGGAASLNGFPDAASVSNWAYAAMSWAVGNGLISGIASDGADYLAPSGGATRAQIAAIMMRYCRLTGL